MRWPKLLILAPVIVAAMVLALPIMALVLTCWLAASIGLVVLVSLAWIPRGQRFLIVYSDSPLWKSYFEEEVLPAFGSSAHVINLSRDGGGKKWWHLDWAAYRHCSGRWNRFPAVYRFSAFGRWSSVRFYDAYMQSKAGKRVELEKAKSDLFLWRPESP
jgi:hypothetical protein